MAGVEQVVAVGQVLVDPGQVLTQRFRALFTLKNLGGKEPHTHCWFSRTFISRCSQLETEPMKSHCHSSLTLRSFRNLTQTRVRSEL